MRLLTQAGFVGFENFADKDKNRILMVIDEAAQLGHMTKLQAAYVVNRGYNMRVWTLWQSLEQLQKLYPDGWNSMISGCDILQFFTPNEDITANYLSRKFGNSTVLKESSSQGMNTGHQQNQQSSQTQGKSEELIEKEFLSPQEAMRLGDDKGILICRGLKYPVMTTRKKFDDDPRFF